MSVATVVLAGFKACLDEPALKLACHIVVYWVEQVHRCLSHEPSLQIILLAVYLRIPGSVGLTRSRSIVV